MIDWERVAELRDEIGGENFAEVVELFLEEVDTVIERLHRAPEPSRYEQDLHFLKGSAWNLGFADFGGLCQQGERLSAAGEPHRVDISAILGCYSASRAAFLAKSASWIGPDASAA